MLLLPLWQKEPKLSRARQIPEWEVYDAEISRFARQLVDKGAIKSHVAAGDVNALASAGAAAGNAGSSENVAGANSADEQENIDSSHAHTRDEL